MTQIVTGKYIRYAEDGITIKEVEEHSIDLEEGDIVRFKDNSLLSYCSINDSSNPYPAGVNHGDDYIPHTGIVARIGAVQTAIDTDKFLGPREIEMPIVILTDEGEIIYCNPLNIEKI